MTRYRMLPLYEGKMGNIYDHRAANFVGTGDTDIVPNVDHSPSAVVQPRYWVRPDVAAERQSRRAWGTETGMLGFRRVARNTDERTCIATVIPWGPASYGWIISSGPDAQGLSFLCAQYDSFVFDFVLRQFLSQPSIPQSTFEQLPTLTSTSVADARWLGPDPYRWVTSRAVRLIATAQEMEALGRECSSAFDSYPWDPELREGLRTELDAAFFCLYGVARDDVDYIMETFPIVKRKDVAAHGEYRTKRMILEIFDAMAEAEATGLPYASPFDELDQ